jgi:co-chaperonin GroES (HSP10)|tara:strand:+ start:871 stop:1128 length:258 start_codon:yes stop_codon:yes gene_type:complete
MQPIGKYIAIKPVEEELKTKSGLLLSAQDAEEFRYKKGLVVKPGSDVSVIKDNDLIYYDRNAGHTMLIDNEQITIIQERDVVVVL